MAKEFLNSEKFIRANRWLIIFTLISSFGYMFLRIYLKEKLYYFDSNILPLEFAIRFHRIFLIIMLIMFVLCYPAFAFSKVKLYIVAIITVFIAPFFCLFSLFSLDSHSIADKIEFNNHTYYAVDYPMITELAGVYFIYRCDLGGRNCSKIFDSVSNYVIPIDFEINDEGNQLNIFVDWEILYIDRNQLIKLDHLYMGYYWPYTINTKYAPQTKKLYISKCNRTKQDQNCALWSLELSNLKIDFEEGYFDYGFEEPVNDEDWNDNYFYVDDELIFYVTDEPVCMIEGCTFVKE